MNMLRDKSRNIQFEAFHVFKVSQLMTSHMYVKVFVSCVMLKNCLKD
jgi:hypothetical protein